jgi:hypothetical protein
MESKREKIVAKQTPRPNNDDNGIFTEVATCKHFLQV